MIKRVNFTGRKRIPRDRIQIEVFDGSPRTFHATINLEESSLLPKAAVCLEAMCAGSTVIERFDCGEVGNLRPLRNQALREVEGENVFFTLKVIDRTELIGRLLGIAENIHPERSGKPTISGRRGILPIEPRDLGEEIWRLEFSQIVCLLVNDKIPGLVDRARSDPLFYAVVYPEVVRRVLTEAIKQNVDIDENDDRWPVLWLRFAKHLHPSKADPPRPDDQNDDKEDWIEEVAKAFCDTHTMKAKYLAALANANGGD